MTNTIKQIFRTLFRFAMIWIIQTVAILIVAWILPGINITATTMLDRLIIAISVALVLATVNILIRPLVLLLALPFGVIALLLVGFFLNAITILLTARVIPEFEVSSILAAFVGGLVFAAIDALLEAFINLDQDDSFFNNLIEKLSRRRAFEDNDPNTNGLVMLEIDGLSYWHIQKAIEKGAMPTVSKMLKEEGYKLSRVDCGLPSQTSACQSGIMFGDNFDIPAFRWYDKERGKLMVSSKDASELNTRYSRGQGLMRGGTSLNNMMAGDAVNSLMTLATIRSGSEEEMKQRARDIYLLFLNPLFFMRTLVYFLIEIFVEIWQGFQQRRKNVQPRLNRLAHFYPALRATTTTIMRDIPAYLASIDILRGTPALYTTYPGYDEVAHHSGPWTSDAFGTLRQYDKVIAHFRRLIEQKASRPYELVVLSDHGQSFGPTFKQRYGYDLKSFIEQHLTPGTSISSVASGDTGGLTLGGLVGELDNVQSQKVGNRAGRATLRQTSKALENTMPTGAEGFEESKVVVCGSGNLGQVYFDLHTGHISLSELEESYPGMVNALVQHEGIGLVLGYQDEQTPIVLGKNGTRNLLTGEVNGEDPFKAYGEPDLRAAQVRRLADFPHNGDLTIISTVYPDGTVAAMEELIGNHGGMGGEQTDAFILHPSEMDVPETANSADVFQILNARRGLPIKPKMEEAAVREIPSWSFATIGRGLADVRGWLGMMVRAILLNRAVYKEVATNPLATGPALFILVFSIIMNSLFFWYASHQSTSLVWELIGRLLISLGFVFIVFLSGRVLGGKGSFTALFRSVSFAHSASLLLIFGLIPGFEQVALFITAILYLLAIWMGAIQSMQLEGWRRIALPVAIVIVWIVIVVVIGLFGKGIEFALQNIQSHLGL